MKSVTIIGSVLLDMIGKYKTEEKTLENKTGIVKISVGGAAYNIAANLAVNGVPAKLVTCLKPNSLSTVMIRQSLENANIDAKYVFEKEGLDEQGYLVNIEVVEEGKNNFISGITCSQINQIDLPFKELGEAIKSATLVALETNLGTAQIQKICDIAKNKPIFVNVVSDAKADRVFQQNFSTLFEVICLNCKEAQTLGINIHPKMTEQEVKQVCYDLNSYWVFISKGKSGYIMLHNDGFFETVAASENPFIVNELGAGDALFAALCASYLKKVPYNSNQSKNQINEWVNRVLRIEEANMGPTGFMEQNDKKEQKDKKRIENRALAMIIFLIFASCAALFGTFSPRISPLLFGLSIFFCSLTSGALGALIREILIRKPPKKQYSFTLFEAIALGMTAGLVSALLTVLQNISVNKAALFTRFDISEYNLLPLFSLIISIGAGLSFEAFFASLKMNDNNSK